MRLDGIDLSQVTLLHDSNIKFIEGQINEPLNDVEIRYNIEEKWADAQPRLMALIFEVVLGICLIGIAAGFWFNIIAAIAADITSLTAQPLSEVVGVLAVNIIILFLTGLLGWAGIYLLRFVYAQYRDKNTQPTPDTIFQTLLTEHNFKVAKVIMFLNPEQTQVVLNIDNKRDIYLLSESSHLEAGDSVLILQWDDYIGIL